MNETLYFFINTIIIIATICVLFLIVKTSRQTTIILKLLKDLIKSQENQNKQD